VLVRVLVGRAHLVERVDGGRRVHEVLGDLVGDQAQLDHVVIRQRPPRLQPLARLPQRADHRALRVVAQPGR
jgi:hypothetical protein